NVPGPDDTVRPETNDVRVRLGALEARDGSARLDVALGPTLFESVQVDLVAIARAGHGAADALLYGSLSLFQRLYTPERVPALLAASDYAPARAGARGLSLVSEALASDVASSVIVADDAASFTTASGVQDFAVNSASVFDNLVSTGANLFINEKFKGNG